LQESLVSSLSTCLTRSLSSAFAGPVAIHPLPTYQLPFGDFPLTLADPTFLALFGTDSGQLALEISPRLAYLILEELLGRSPGNPPFIPARPFTEFESRLLAPILEQLVGDLSSTCSEQLGTLRLDGLHANPSALHLAPPNEPVTVASFDVYIGRQTGRLTFCLPLSLTSDLPISDDHPVSLRALIAQTTLTLQELSILQPGDIVTTQTPAGTHVMLLSAHHLLRGELVHYLNKRAVRITTF